MPLLTEHYASNIHGTLSCYDRILIQGIIPFFNNARGMTIFLVSNNIRIFDYPLFAKKLRDQIRSHAESVAEKNNIKIQFIRKAHVRKLDIVKKIIPKRGSHPGLVHIISAMEPCQAYQPWHNKITHQTYLRYDTGKCLHFYFYFIDKNHGLCFLRVPTWCPFRLQFYFNGHSWLASQLSKNNIPFSLLDNAFLKISDFNKAQQISDAFDVSLLHRTLDSYANLFCPVINNFPFQYHWTVAQAEYATDIIFKHQNDLQNIYDNLLRTTIYTVKPDNIASFLGKKIAPKYQGEIGNRFNIRIEGTRIKHQMGPVFIKMYDKFKLILRIETAVSDLSFFKHYRKVDKRDGTSIRKFTNMKKNIYSLSSLQHTLFAANSRYLLFISSIDDKSAGIKNLNKISKSVSINNNSYKGFNLFNHFDLAILSSIHRGEFNISGFANKHLQILLQKSSSQVSRILKRLRLHGLIKKIRNTYKYYLTKLGRTVIATGLKLKELFVIPQLCF